MYFKMFLLQLGFNIALYMVFYNELNIAFLNLLSLIIHVTFLTMIINYICCLVQHRHEQKFNPEWFFIPILQWSEIKQSLYLNETKKRMGFYSANHSSSILE